MKIVKSSKGETFFNFLQLNMKHVYTAAVILQTFLMRIKINTHKLLITFFLT